MSAAQEQALALVKERGWFVFRLHVEHDESKCDGGTANCKVVDAGRHRWSLTSSNDPDVVAGWDWSRSNGYGIDCGKSGLLVADLDPGATWPFTDTRVHRSGRGLHYIYEDVIGLGNRVHLEPWGVDVRGDGGMVIGPGSWHPHGSYEVVSDVDPADAPEALLAALSRPSRAVGQAEAEPLDMLEALDRLEGVYRRMQATPIGQRNHTLNVLAGTAAGLWVRLDETDQRGELGEDRVKARLLESVPDDDDEAKSRDTLERGWGYGLAHPVVDAAESPAVEEVERKTEQARLVPGGSFVLDIPDAIPAVWGEGTKVVWAEGEAFTLAGPAGVGKTTLAGQVVRGRLAGGTVLGMPVAPTSSKVLYLAMDRPRQIARSLRRTLGDVDRVLLDERLVVWVGPPLKDMAEEPETLLRLAEKAGADTVVVDSVKDAAVGLSDDRVGAGYNRARQMCLAAGVEVMELHHMVKKGENGADPTSLAHVYGSAWITAGSGSVALLWGQAGDPVVRWLHLKQPAEEVGPFPVEHDHLAGTSRIQDAVDLVVVARSAGKEGTTAKGAACVLFETTKPTPAQKQKAWRRLDGLVRSGYLRRVDGDDSQQKPTVWVAAEVSDFSETG